MSYMSYQSYTSYPWRWRRPVFTHASKTGRKPRAKTQRRQGERAGFCVDWPVVKAETCELGYNLWDWPVGDLVDSEGRGAPTIRYSRRTASTSQNWEATRMRRTARVLILAGTILSAAASLSQSGDFVIQTRVAGSVKDASDEELTDLELLILKEIRGRQGVVTEMYGLLEGWSGTHRPQYRDRLAGIIIVQYGDRLELRRYLSDQYRRYYARPLARSAFKSFRDQLSAAAPTELPGTRTFYRSEDGGVVEETGPNRRLFFHLTRQGGVRVLFDVGAGLETARREEISRYQMTEKAFRALVKGDDAWRTHYDLPRPISGFKVLYGNPRYAVTHVWLDQGQIVGKMHARVLGEERMEAFQESEAWYIRDGKRLSAAQIPPDRREFPGEKEVGGHRLRPFRDSSDGRWICGFCGHCDRFMCWDQAAGKWQKLRPALSQGRWFPLYYCSLRRAFILGRFDPSGLDGFAWKEPLALSQATTQIRIFNPGDDVESNRPGEADLRTKLARTRRIWFQQLPRTLQRRAGTDGVVWISAPGTSVSTVVPFDLRRWEVLSQEAMVVPGFEVETSRMFVDEARRRLLVAYKGDLLEFPFPAIQVRR